MNLEIGLWVAAQFPEKDYINGIFVADQIQCMYSRMGRGTYLPKSQYKPQASAHTYIEPHTNVLH
jgi:hypothetical protein